MSASPHRSGVTVVRFCSRYLLAAVVILFSSALLAASPPPAAPPGETRTPPEVLAADREDAAFLDALIEAERLSEHIPGAEAAFVRDGRLIFAHGYGVANLVDRRPVDPAKTLFRIASISKLFIWTAVMQLVEQGKLDLDEDVNHYLSAFKIPDTFPQPITLANLMSHSAGFEEHTPIFTSDSRQLEPLEEYLANHMPRRVFPPGSVTAYSNYGAALAAYIVGVQSGMPYEQYVQERIFKPLGMEHTSLQQPLPEALAGDLAQGYYVQNGNAQAYGPDWILTGPAGSASSTALDLSRFMIAQLQLGRFGDTRILEEETAREMQRRTFANDPRVNGFAHGFFEVTIDGHRALWHGGVTPTFNSAFVLVPEAQAGFFVTFNTSSGRQAVINVVQAFIHRLTSGLPQSEHTAPVGGPAGDAQEVAGEYLTTRMNYSNYTRVASLFRTMRIRALPSGELAVEGEGARSFGKYAPLSAGVYRPLGEPAPGAGKLVTRVDPDGKRWIFFENDPSVGFHTIPWYRSPGTNFDWLILVVVLSIVQFVAAARFLLNPTRRAAPARFINPAIAAVACACSLVFLVLFVAGVQPPQIFYGGAPWLDSLPYLAWFIVLLALACLGLLIHAFVRQGWREAKWAIAGTVATLAFSVWLATWNWLVLSK